MLGNYVRILVTNPIHSINKQYDFEYLLNFGVVEGVKQFDSPLLGAYIMGIFHPVRSFDGRVIAVIHRNEPKAVLLVVAPKSMEFIDNQIRNAIAFAEAGFDYNLDCLYERSCGAIVFRNINDEIRFLLIKNKRSAHWGFPKGHIELGETQAQTAIREVLEETGLHIEIVPEFVSKSEYTIQKKVEKSVTIFLAKTTDTKTTIQREEVEDYIWLNYDKAFEMLRFENDKTILEKANVFLSDSQIKY
ncbi:MAG: NUDIX domain-containing protein [Eubacteriales bacterium]